MKIKFFKYIIKRLDSLCMLYIFKTSNILVPIQSLANIKDTAIQINIEQYILFG